VDWIDLPKKCPETCSREHGNESSVSVIIFIIFTAQREVGYQSSEQPTTDLSAGVSKKSNKLCDRQS
jgi:hypothetical protein